MSAARPARGGRARAARTERARTARSWRASAIALLVVLASLLAACSGVPKSSDPQVVKNVGPDARTPAAPSTPPAGADPRTIVTGFLANNVSTDVRHTNARQYLTGDAQKRWQDTSATIVNDIRPTTADPLTGEVVVNAIRIGSLASDGTYTPTLPDPANPNANAVVFTFEMVRVDQQWRIDQLANGLVITQDDFAENYSQFPVYFFDSTENALVPDMRYTATNGQSLATFLLTQLIAGPRPDLSVLVNQMPDQPATSNPTVTVGQNQVTDIDLVSVKQLPSAVLTKLAVQLAFTLSSSPADKPAQRTGIDELRLVESGAPVVLPGRSATFSRRDFGDYLASSQVEPDVLFIRNGVAFTSTTKKALIDPAAGGLTNLTSVVRARGTPASQGGQGVEGSLAAVGATAAGDQLYVGPTAQSLAPVPAVRAPHLTRPTWAMDEAWVSDGATIWRVSAAGAVLVAVTARPSGVQGAVVSMRFSRDGGRLAIVYDVPGTGRALWVGAVVRSGGDARVEQLTQITPAIGRLDDVAWSDESTLFIVGQQTSGDYGIWSVKVDGSLLTQKTTADLPLTPGDPRPLTVTAAPSNFAWIAVGGSLWQLSGATWSPAMSDPFSPTTTTEGSSPAFQD